MITRAKKEFTIKVTAACATVVLATGFSGTAFAQTNLKWAHVDETSESFHKWSVRAAEEIKKCNDDRYEAQVFPASSLGKESDINQGLTPGTVNIILTGASFAGRTNPLLLIRYFPFIFRDTEHQLKYAKNDAFRELADGYDKKSGNHVTAMTYCGARDATSNRPIRSLEDMKGPQVRMPGAPAHLAFPKA